MLPMTRGKNGARSGSRPPAVAGRGAPPRGAAAAGTSSSVASTSDHADNPVEMPPLGMAVASSWGWRIMAVFSLVALGLVVTFFFDGKTVFAILWIVVTAAWAFFTYQLRLRHLAWDKS